MKKKSNLLVILFLLPFFIKAQIPPVGNGTIANPYQINILDNLLWISQNSSEWNKYFIQTADIDASSVNTWVTIGNNITNFNGNYNGQGYSISNLNINEPLNSYLGLFGYINGQSSSNLSVIKNLKLINFNITGFDNVGALVGFAQNSKIDSVIVSGNVSGRNSVGGIIGRFYGSSSSNLVEIHHSRSTCLVNGNTWVGGLIGSNEGSSGGSSIVENSYYFGDVTGISYVGGIAGMNSATAGTILVQNCYSRGSVTRLSGTNLGIGAFIGRNSEGQVINCYSSSNVFYNDTVITDKGFIGNEFNAGIYNNNFFDTTTTNQNNSIGATPKSENDFKTACTFISAGWDFVYENTNGTGDYWNIDGFTNSGYPFLQFESVNVTAPGSAINFDGTNDYMLVNNYSGLNLNNNYTIEAWIKPEGFNHFAGIISKYHTVNANGFILRLSANSPYTGLEFDQMTTANGLLNSGQWYHVAAVNDNGTRHLYLNGIEQTLTGTPLNVVNNTNNLTIGVDYLNAPRYFNGDIDEVRIWNTTKSLCDIKISMYTELSGNEAGLVAYFNFNEGVPNLNNSCQSKLAINKPNTLYNAIPVNMTLNGITSNWITSDIEFIEPQDTINIVILNQLPNVTTNNPTALPDYTGLITTNKCDSVNIIQIPSPGTLMNEGVNLITLIATSSNNSYDTIYFNFIVLDSLKYSEVLYYKFNETDTNVTNYASNPPTEALNATIMGSITQGSSGQCGGALIGSGIYSNTDYLNTNWATDLGTSSWTITFWSSGFAPNTTLYYIFGDATANSLRCFTNGVAGSNNWLLRGGGLTDVLLNGGATNTPSNNAFVYDSVTHEVKAYLNGILVNTVTQTSPNISGTGPFKIMGYNSNIGAPSGGLLDEFRVYRRALTDSEIVSLLNLNNSGTDSIVACDSYTWIDGNTYTTSNNTATYLLTNTSGCDSLVTLNLTINISSIGTDSIVACDSYTWIDGNTYTTSNNTATYLLANTSGCDSLVTLNLTIKNSSTRMDSIVACNSYYWIDGNTYTASNNTATYILTNAVGCDSIITLNLTINTTPDVSTTTNMATITSNQTGANYQWIDCNNNYSLIIGETNQSFTATVNGSYAVIVDNNYCSDTSACVIINGLNLNDNFEVNNINVFPNPANNYIFINSKSDILNLKIIDLVGNIIMEESNLKKSEKIDVSKLPNNIYFIKIETNSFVILNKFIKL